MNRTRFVFGLLYVVIILLLLLMMMRKCQHQGEEIKQVPPEAVVEVPVTDENAENIARNIGHMGKMKVTLLWNERGDIDLHVVEPNNAHIWFHDKHPANAHGELDYDNTEGGNGSAENIYWNDPPRGSYKLFVNYYCKKAIADVQCKVLVFLNGELVNTYSCTLSREGESISLPDIVVN